MLSKRCKYALKALEYIAKKDVAVPILIAEISEKQHIPKKFLEAILLDLRHDGILQSRKGKNGGYSLRIPASEVNIGHVIRLIDGPIALIPCVSYKYYERCAECTDEETCGLRNIVQDVREATNKILSKVTLADMLNREHRLSRKKHHPPK